MGILILVKPGGCKDWPGFLETSSFKILLVDNLGLRSTRKLWTNNIDILIVCQAGFISEIMLYLITPDAE
jgi:hypothetical protein